MTSYEIEQEQKSLPRAIEVSPDMDAGNLTMLSAIALAAWEVAYQLAVMNERAKS